MGEQRTLSREPSETSYDFILRTLKNISQGVDLRYVPPIDLKAILMLTSYLTDSEYGLTIQTPCPLCGTINLMDKGLDEIEFEELKETNITVAGENQEDLVFRYLTVDDMIFLEQREDEPLNSLHVLAAMLTPLPPSKDLEYEDKFRLNIQKVFDLPPSYSKTLPQVEGRLLPALQTLNCVCRSCRENFRVFPQIEPEELFNL